MAGDYIVYVVVICTLINTSLGQNVQAVYEGQNIRFQCKAKGVSRDYPVHYQWEFENRVIIASDDHFTLRNVQKKDEGEYKCIATQFIDGEPKEAVETTLIRVRTADSIVTQDVEEGFMVRILCNVTGDDRPHGAGPLRYEWRNPNGTMIGSQWKLELGHIGIHESGVYVCRVSYTLNDKQKANSSATRINVLKRAGIIFPGLRENVIEALETGHLKQECKVISSKPSEYTHKWYGPNGNRLVSSTPYLQRDYILRPKDEGVYKCVATPTEIGRGVVENDVVVTITPLRFQITTVAEDLRPGGFTRRRVSYVPPGHPTMTTRETFTYQWFGPDGSPLASGQGPEMYVQLRNSEDFGRYFVRVHGSNSGYTRDLMSYVTLREGIVDPSYTVVIREVSGPLYFNARLELECAINPPNPGAQINWLSPDGTVVSDSSNLMFDKFQYHHQGRYTCQILLPNHVVLRQSVDLIASGTGPEYPGYVGLYSIMIQQTPLLFTYNDAVRLQCIVTPTPPMVQFEWLKDGHIIGRQSELLIPNFTSYDVGRYLCKARIEGSPDLSSNATITPGTVQPDSVDLVMRPDVIYQPVFTPFQIECISERSGLWPVAELSNGASIESDNQFELSRPNSQRLTIRAPRGLSSVYNGYRIRCSLPNVGSKETTLYLIDSCPSHETQCRTEQCVPTLRLCDGRLDCKDRSDESELFCNGGITVSPTRISVRPSESFTLRCLSRIPGEQPHARVMHTGVDVERDPRFRTERPSKDVLVIFAPLGLQLSANNTHIECYFPARGTRVAVINVVDDGCAPGSFRCVSDGRCISKTRVCDGTPDCSDQMDERDCAVSCFAPNIACPSGECLSPDRRCDGHIDCRDGFDERGCPHRCMPPKFACGSGECLAPGQKCDGRVNCADGSDEFGCAPIRECLPPNFQCPSGECLPIEKRCDGQMDCRDGFDEQMCGSVGCRSDQFTCSNGDCIDRRLRCDGRPDCHDRSDEQGCDTGPSIRPERIVARPYDTLEFSCLSNRVGVQPVLTIDNGTAIDQLPRFVLSRPSTDLVIGRLPLVTERDRGLRIICSYPTGERTTSEIIIESHCPLGEMMCRDRSCIHERLFCNGLQECRDGSDEHETICANVPGCRPPNFHCSSGECVPRNLRCNGRQDCYDGSDEADCEIGPTLRPDRPTIRPYSSVQLECRSNKPGVRPIFTLDNGTLVDHVSRFVVSRPSLEVVLVGINDLTERDRNLRFRCAYPTGEYVNTEIIIESPCGLYEMMCRDGTCIRQEQFCDGRPDCADGSDEREPHCASPSSRCAQDEFLCSSGECIRQNLVCNYRRDCYDGSDELGCGSGPSIRPIDPVVRPYGSVQIECRSTLPGTQPSLIVDNGTSVDALARFQVIRPSTEQIIAVISSLTERDQGLRLRCLIPTGQSVDTRIVIDSPCEHHEMMCRDGSCVRRDLFCDGRPDCADRSDEQPPHCDTPTTPQPQKYYLTPYSFFRIECRSSSPAYPPVLTVNNGTPVEQLPRFEVTRPNPDKIIAILSNLTERDSGMILRCTAHSSRPVISEIIIQSPCEPSQMMCRDGGCVPANRFCDGRADCLDGSDERPPHCESPPVCSSNQFTCRSGECVPLGSRCDGRRDCYDGSDESGCVYGPTMQPERPVARPYGSIQFECSSSRPGVEPRMTVDNGTAVDRLPRFTVYKPNPNVIIARIEDLTENDRGLRLRCFYPTGEESSRVIEIESPCDPIELMCRDGTCVRREYFCNGRPDCPDESDERPPHCAAPRCASDHFSCTSGECVRSDMVCNGRDDCYDGSDEKNCIVRPVIRPERVTVRPYGMAEITCTSNQQGIRPQLRLYNGTSVEQLTTFDVIRPNVETVIARTTSVTERERRMIIQCVFPTGEVSQSEILIESPCAPYEMMCRDGTCVNANEFCDGQMDCPDGSDERPPHCHLMGPTIQLGTPTVRPYGTLEVTCESHQFGIRPELRLANGTSVEQLMRFQVDRPSLQKIIARLSEVTEEDHGMVLRCVYRTGEFVEVMVTVDTPCGPNERMCRDGGCVSRHRFCDGRRDCSDGSDESSPICHRRCSAGQFECRSGECLDDQRRCDGRRDCRDGSDEESCDTGPIMRPNRVRVRPYGSMEVECRAMRPGASLQVHLSNGTEVERLSRFEVLRPAADVVIVRMGPVTERDANLVIICSYPTGESSQTHIIVDTPCGPSDMMCRDGTCLSRQSFCNGRRECADGSDEEPPHCAVHSDIQITPDRIQTMPYKSFKIECISSNPAVRPYAQLPDGRLVAEDPRFQVTQLTPTHLEIRVTHGLTERDDNLVIHCVFPGIGNRTAIVDVLRPCPPGEYQCVDGTCIPSSKFCNGYPDCPDRSDESERYCRVDVAVTPSVITVKPFESFHFECISRVNGTAPHVFIDGYPMDDDPRFVLNRPTVERVIVVAPQGVPDRGGHIFECVSVTGGRKQVIVRTESSCPVGHYQCQSGECIPVTSFCDGRYDCTDRSDEDARYCAVDVLIIPGYIYTTPYSPVEFVCDSRTPGVEPFVRFADGRPLEADTRFSATRPTKERVVVTTDLGLNERDDNMKLVCYTVTGLHKEILVQVESDCPPNHARCRDQTCRPTEMFCNGRRDCPDGSDEDPKYCAVHVIVKPGVIRVRPSEPFTYECTSTLSGHRPEVTVDGQLVELNPHFRVERPNVQMVVLTADRGLPDSGIHVIGCSVTGGLSKEVLVTVDGVCRPDEFQCRDGTCIPSGNTCNGRNDCPDGSDETAPHCPVRPSVGRLLFTPGEIRVQPGRPIRLECQTDVPEETVEVLFIDGRPIHGDSRFVVSKPATNRIVIDVPYGLEVLTREVILQCRSSTGARQNATIYVDQSCQPGQRRCPGGECIYAGQFCDGRIDCAEGYDERPDVCAVCDPISKPCEVVNGQPPSVSHFQIHWLCDGENDCGNGFDELDCRNDTRNVDPQCGSTHFRCTSGSSQYIPHSYWCDGTMDCTRGEDEQDCAAPSITEPIRTTESRVRPGETLVLECEAAGVPPPMIIWRFNWNCLRDTVRTKTEVIPSTSGCRGSRSRLTIRNFQPGDDGIYNCEALRSNHRAMSQDFLALLS